MTELTKMFYDYILLERKYSAHTASSYSRDVEKFLAFINEYEKDVLNITSTDIRDFLTIEMMNGVSKRTLKRELSSLRHFYDYLSSKEFVKFNPFLSVTSPKVDKRLPEFLYYEEVEKLLSTNALREDPLMIRDQAILELLYASGMRAFELCTLKNVNIDFRNRTLRILGKGNKE